MKKQIKWKILAPTILVFIVSIAIILSIVIVTASGELNVVSNAYLSEQNNRYADDVQNTVDDAINMTDMLRPLFVNDIVFAKGNRESAMASLTAMMESNPSVFGVFAYFEPNAYDGKDMEYVNTQGGDETGRFNIYFYRGASGIESEPIASFETNGVDNYPIYKETKKDAISGPYPFDVGGETKYVVTVNAMIVIDGEFKGLIGIDFLVDSLIENIKTATLFETGYMNAIDSDGILLYDAVPDDIGRSVFDFVDAETAGLYRNALAKGESFSINSQIEGYGTIRISTMPIKLDDRYWLIGSFVPAAEISAASSKIMFFGVCVGVAAVVAMLVILIYIITKVVTKPVSQLVDVARNVAKGNFNVNINASSADEMGVLSRSFIEVINAINNLADDVTHMAVMHNEKGEIEVFIDESKLPGRFGEVAKSANAMVTGHIDTKKLAMSVLSKMAGGDFNVHMPQLPGKKAFINDAIEEMRGNIKAVAEEIGDLIVRATKGDLSVRAGADKFNGGWAAIMNNMNELLEMIIAPINEASDVLGHVSNGNFEHKMAGNYKGDFLVIKKSINTTVENMNSYIDEISKVLAAIAKNDLNQEITREYVGKFKTIKEALNNIISTLNNVIGNITTAAEQVASGAKTISDSSMALAEGTTEQASTVEELNATISKINEGTSRNAQSAATAESLSISSKKNAAKGSADMKNMLGSMDSIKDSSEQITKIIKIIDDIAFQTNLLALNAAVEAARAGEHGKGFAVVATEVRTLASRSQEAAQNTTGLIEESIRRVNDGMKIAGLTAEELNTIVADIDKVGEIITNIAQSSKEQEEAIGQVMQGVEQITNVVQNNSATSEETAAAAQELASQSDVMHNLVSIFNMKNK